MVIHALNTWIQSRMGFSTGLHLNCIHWQGGERVLIFCKDWSISGNSWIVSVGCFWYNMEICFSWGIWGLDVVWPVHLTLVWQAKCGRKWGTWFIPIAEYRSEFMKPAKNRKDCKPVRLL
jgi:hypothetical protein